MTADGKTKPLADFSDQQLADAFDRLMNKGFGHVGLAKSNLVPEGQIYHIFGDLVAAPLTHWSITHEGRYPFLSRYAPGMIELERERRRRSR